MPARSTSVVARVLLATFAGAAFAVAACGTDAVGVDSCKEIEEARCRRAPGCMVSLTDPPHRDPDVDACIRFYDIACLHGLEVPNDPGAVVVQACVNAIENNGCPTVLNPETDPACAWLVPAPTPPEAGADAPDAAVDGEAATD